MTDTQFKILDHLAIQPLKAKGAQVWVFGSRARNDHQPLSDIDLLFKFSGTFPSGLAGQIAENLEESRLPFKVDLVAESDLDVSYREGVFRDRIAV